MSDATDAAGIDYSAVLVDLEAKRDALNNAIESIRAIVAGGGASSQNNSLSRPVKTPATKATSPADVAPDAFFGMGTADAAKKYLSMVRGPRDTKEIAEALNLGGLVHQSKDFNSTLYVSLNRREKSPGDFTRVNGKWALTEWYPGRKTARTSDEE